LPYACCFSDDGLDEEAQAAAENAAEEIVKNFEQEMAAVVQNLDRAQMAFDDLSGVRGGGDGGVGRGGHGSGMWWILEVKDCLTHPADSAHLAINLYKLNMKLMFRA
jgi:hypothetical protein